MAQSQDPVIPGLIGNFNIPKAVIENKVDVLAFLEILVRKGVVSAQELDEIRAAVVAHLNAIYPELDLQYATPESMGQQAGLGGSALPPQQNANTGGAGMASAAFQPTSQPKPAASFKPTAAAQAFLAEDAQQAKTGQAQSIPAGSPENAASAVNAPAENPAAPAPAAQPAQAANAPLYVSAPPPKFIK